MTISQNSAGKKNDSEVKITVNVDVGVTIVPYTRGEGGRGKHC